MGGCAWAGVPVGLDNDQLCPQPHGQVWYCQHNLWVKAFRLSIRLHSPSGREIPLVDAR